jgi:hypothetical protein
MHGRAPTGPNPWRWGVLGLLVVLLAWLVPNPLPWRSPFQSSGPHRSGAQAADLSIGAAVAARTQRSVSTSSTPAKPKPKPKPAPPRVPAGFRGAWRGEGVNFLGSPKFTVIVTFPTSTPGSVVATADFPTIGCQEVWQLEQGTPTVLTLRATLAGGPCLVRPLRVQVRLLDRSHLFVQWRLLNSVVESEAQLMRVS